MPKYVDKQLILQGYQQSGKAARLKRESAFIDLQEIGHIPMSETYSDEAYFKYIGADLAALPSPEAANQYLTGVLNKLALIDFKRMSGNRNELFDSGLKQPLPYGDSVELIYTQLKDDEGYDSTKFVPTALSGGDLVLSQRLTLSSVTPTTNNPDKRTIQVNVPMITIMQALNSAITTGLSNGWPSIFDEQLRRGWEKFKFERFRYMTSLLGGTPSSNEWTTSTTTFTENTGSFEVAVNAITDSTTFEKFLIQLYQKSADLEGSYSTGYNPAGINKIQLLPNQKLILDSSLQAYWRDTNAILFNSEYIDVKRVFSNVEFVKFLPSKVKTEATQVYGIIYEQDGNDVPIQHYPITNSIMRYNQLWATNVVSTMADHFWLISGIDLSKNVVVFYAPA